ncbi:hypothetical protein EQG49_12720 [Periweissella cryptocerci]|uniref:Phage protein n=1 Tax=Periweissella cryptocerci TaxID=2506420 RepID=A0A4P6YWS7_9LACO|nr:hypothetical protein [Periweissella cryptocerci]QBO37261.1 hypothetical protein EQG49_12720 [Periweissella cryptocerci]
MLNYDTLELIQQTAHEAMQNKIIEHEGETFLIQGNKIERYQPDDRVQTVLEVAKFAGIVDLIKKPDTLGVVKDGTPRLITAIQVVDETKVNLLGDVDNAGRREVLAVANAYGTPFYFDNYYDTEDAVIKLQALFADTEDRALVLKFLGNLTDGESRTLEDDGITQAATIKTGIASKGEAKVPNPVKLKPFRTFLEVEQPESPFIFRVKEGPRAALYEADGGYWKIQAINNIKQYFVDALGDEFPDILVLA